MKHAVLVLCVVVGLGSVAMGAHAEWEIQKIGGQSSVNRIALDSANRPHFLYIANGGYLQYVSPTGTKTVDNRSGSGVGGLVIDDSGNPHIAYTVPQTYPNHGFLYTSFDGTNWSTQVVDTGGGPNLAKDGNGRLHVAHVRDGSLRYSSYIGGSWRQEYSRPLSTNFDLAIDSNNRAHLSYSYQTPTEWYLGYSADTGAGWGTIIDPKSVGVFMTRIAVDSNDKPHILYKGAGGLYYTTRDNLGFWSDELITRDYAGSTAGWAIDSEDRIHLSFQSGDTDVRELRYGLAIVSRQRTHLWRWTPRATHILVTMMAMTVLHWG